MRSRLVLGVVVVALAGVVAAAFVLNPAPVMPSGPHAEGSLRSPRLAGLAARLRAGDVSALAAFWKDLEGRAPLVEPVDGDPQWSWITFVWRGDRRTQRVDLAGGPPSGRSTPMARLDDTDLWFRTERIRNDARFVYWFFVNAPDERPTDFASYAALMDRFPLKPDPLAAREYDGRSLVELPNAPPQPWVGRGPDVPRGSVRQATLHSRLLNQTRPFTIYTPPNYDPAGAPCGLLVMFDGPDDHEPIILDNLIAARKVPPLVMLQVTHVDRGAELSCSESFAGFIATELVPWARQHYRVSPDAKRTIVRGTSLGGLMASYCALRYPDVFGGVISQSGSYWWWPGAMDGTAPTDAEPGWLIRQFASAPRAADTRFYLEAGTFEDAFPSNLSLLAANRHLRDVLSAKGYTVHYAEYTGGHDPLSWRGSLADALPALTAEAQLRKAP